MFKIKRENNSKGCCRNIQSHLKEMVHEKGERAQQKAKVVRGLTFLFSRRPFPSITSTGQDGRSSTQGGAGGKMCECGILTFLLLIHPQQSTWGATSAGWGALGDSQYFVFCLHVRVSELLPLELLTL